MIDTGRISDRRPVSALVQHSGRAAEGAQRQQGAEPLGRLALDRRGHEVRHPPLVDVNLDLPVDQLCGPGRGRRPAPKRTVTFPSDSVRETAGTGRPWSSAASRKTTTTSSELGRRRTSSSPSRRDPPKGATGGPLVGAEHACEQRQDRHEARGRQPRRHADQHDQQQQPATGADERVATHNGSDPPAQPPRHVRAVYGSAIEGRGGTRPPRPARPPMTYLQYSLSTKDPARMPFTRRRVSQLSRTR